MFATLAAWFAKSVLLRKLGGIFGAIGRAIGRFFAALNVQGWIGLVACLVLSVGWIHTGGEARHWKKQSGRFETLYRAELEHEKRIAAQALALKTRIDAATAKISKVEKDRNDAENRRISSAADALRLRGPGKAACASNAQPSAAASGHEPDGRAGNAAVDPVPHRAGVDLIGVPFDDEVTYGKNHDTYRAEVMSWRRWYDALVKVWPH